jgi:hypothetical protein
MVGYVKRPRVGDKIGSLFGVVEVREVRECGRVLAVRTRVHGERIRLERATRGTYVRYHPETPIG